MASVLQFRNDLRRNRRDDGLGYGPASDPGDMGQVIIFPGVRIDRSDLDLSHRLVQVPPSGEGASGSTAGKP